MSLFAFTADAPERQCGRWGYRDINETKLQVQNMREANIPLEVMWNDIDLYHAVRDFTTDPVSFPADEVRAFIEELVSASNSKVDMSNGPIGLK